MLCFDVTNQRSYDSVMHLAGFKVVRTLVFTLMNVLASSSNLILYILLLIDHLNSKLWERQS